MGKRIKTERMRKNKQNQLLTVHTSTNSNRPRERYCLCCEKELKSKNSRRKFCSDKCRLFFWAVSTLIKEFKAGRVNGLRHLIQELCK